MVIPAGYAQANILFGGSSLPTNAEVTMGLNVGTFAGDPTDAANAIIAGIATSALEDLWAITVQLTGVRVKFGPDETGPTGEASAAVDGDAGGAASPPNVALLVQKVTSLGGRAGRGRQYWPGFPETQVDGAGNIDGSFLAVAQGVFDDWHAKLITDDLEPVLLHGADSPISLPTAITSLVVAPVIATQRRRLRR